MQKTSFVTIRGTKEGLVLLLDDECAFSELLQELSEKLSSKHSQISKGKSVHVKVSVGNRYLTEEQKEQLKKVISEKQKLTVGQFESNVITRKEADELQQELETVRIVKVIRSGQVLEVTGDLLLLGDVNPGGTVKASGNIYILGVLRGIAHAGCMGNREAVITASKMEPVQIKIANLVSRSPEGSDRKADEIECAYISEDNKIAVERVQNLGRIRPNLVKVENG